MKGFSTFINYHPFCCPHAESNITDAEIDPSLYTIRRQLNDRLVLHARIVGVSVINRMMLSSTFPGLDIRCIYYGVAWRIVHVCLSLVSTTVALYRLFYIPCIYYNCCNWFNLNHYCVGPNCQSRSIAHFPSAHSCHTIQNTTVCLDRLHCEKFESD